MKVFRLLNVVLVIFVYLSVRNIMYIVCIGIFVFL